MELTLGFLSLHTHWVDRSTAALVSEGKGSSGGPLSPEPAGLTHTEVGGCGLRCDMRSDFATRLLIKSEEPCVHLDFYFFPRKVAFFFRPPPFFFSFGCPECHRLCRHESMCPRCESPPPPVTVRLPASCGSQSLCTGRAIYIYLACAGSSLL